MNVGAFTVDGASRSDAAIEEELLTLNAHMAAASYRFLMLVRTFDERTAWGDWGTRSMAHWLGWRCGIALGAAREQVRVAHALAGLPLTSTALAEAKVRALSRVATAETETFFLNAAKYGTASHLEKIVRYAKQGIALDDPDRVRAMVERCVCDRFFDDDGMLVLRARLMPDDGARLVSAINAMRAEVSSAPIAAQRASALGNL